MARHLAICERKSAYPSRSEAKAAIVTHSMLDVLGLVRKPEEGPSGTSKRTVTKQEPVVVEDSLAPQSNDLVEEEDKNAVEESAKQVETTNTVEEAEDKTENVVEETKNKDEKEAAESDEKATVVDAEKEQEDDKEVVEDENEATAATAADEAVHKDVDKDEESEKVDSGIVEAEKETPEEVPSSSKPVEDATVDSSSDIVKSPEEASETMAETATEEGRIEKDDEVSTTLTESLDESQNEVIEATPEQSSLKNVEDIVTAPEDVQSVAEEAEKELEVPQEPVGAREQVSPVNEMETSEVVQEKATLETEITSDDIQNLISDVVGEKSNTGMGFDVQTMDDSANMETETDINAFSTQEMASARQIEDVAMNQEESMEVPEMPNEVMDCEVVTPMETD